MPPMQVPDLHRGSLCKTVTINHIPKDQVKDNGLEARMIDTGVPSIGYRGRNPAVLILPAGNGRIGQIRMVDDSGGAGRRRR